jgi:hypothetical protein
MDDLTSFYLTIMTGFGFVTMVAYLGGAWICFAHRRISRWLILVSAGFAGEFLASSIRQINAMRWQFYSPGTLSWSLLFDLGLHVLGFLSMIVGIFGLGAALVDIRRKLALLKRPVDDLA